MTCADSNTQNQAGGGAEVPAAIGRRERQPETRHWREDKNSPGVGGRGWGSRNPPQLPSQGSLTGGPATETLPYLSSEGFLGNVAWPPGGPWIKVVSTQLPEGLAADIQLHDGLVVITNTLSLSKLRNPDLFISENCFHQDNQAGLGKIALTQPFPHPRHKRV